MPRRLTFFGLAIAISAASCFALGARAAAPASETVFPASTKLFVSTASIDGVIASWNKTQLGQLMADPTMKPFEEDFRDQLRRKWQAAHQRLGLTWEEFSKAPSGEASVAVIEPSKGGHAQAVFADCAGHEQQVAELIAKITKTMTERHAVQSEHDVQGVKITMFAVPKQGDAPAYESGYAVHDGVLLGADDLKVLDAMVARLGHESKDSLASVEAFKAVVARCQKSSGELAPQIRWFVEPFGYADVTRAANSNHRQREHDLLKILRNQGFDAVQGVGGFVNLALDAQRELLHRTMVYAPPVEAGGAEKYKLGARMLNFPNTESLAPPAWAPREIAAFSAFNLKTKEAFEASETLVNEYVGDDVWKDVLEGIRDDPNGAMVDVRKDIVSHLGERIVMLSDYHLPITTKSERVLIAIETTDAKLLASAIERMMRIDPNARRREFNNHVIWEMVEEENPLPMVVIENQPGFAEAAKDETEEGAKEPRLPPNSAVAVANGWMFWSTNIDLMIKILGQTPGQELLSDSVDFKLVGEELKKYAASENCAMNFSRTDEEYRPVYELFRAGRMPESETMFGKLLNVLLSDNRAGVPRAPRLDGSKLPDFEAVRRYFGPAGATITTESDGWFMTGFTLNKQPE